MALTLIVNIGNESATRTHNRKTRKTNEQTDINNVNRQDAGQQEAANIQRELQYLYYRLKQTEQQLQIAHSMGVIYKDYRGFGPVGCFCQYLESVGCDSLTGHEGAYNLYENERRLNLIILKEDQILNNQEGSMPLLRDALIEKNNTLNRIENNLDSSLGRIENNSAIAAYNSDLQTDYQRRNNWLLSMNLIK